MRPLHLAEQLQLTSKQQTSSPPHTQVGPRPETSRDANRSTQGARRGSKSKPSVRSRKVCYTKFKFPSLLEIPSELRTASALVLQATVGTARGESMLQAFTGMVAWCHARRVGLFGRIEGCMDLPAAIAFTSSIGQLMLALRKPRIGNVWVFFALLSTAKPKRDWCPCCWLCSGLPSTSASRPRLRADACQQRADIMSQSREANVVACDMQACLDAVSPAPLRYICLH